MLHFTWKRLTRNSAIGKYFLTKIKFSATSDFIQLSATFSTKMISIYKSMKCYSYYYIYKINLIQSKRENITRMTAGLPSPQPQRFLLISYCRVRECVLTEKGNKFPIPQEVSHNHADNHKTRTCNSG